LAQSPFLVTPIAHLLIFLSSSLCYWLNKEVEPLDTGQVSVLDEAARLADFLEEGNQLLKKIKDVARRIEDRCRNAVSTDPDIGQLPPSGSA